MKKLAFMINSVRFICVLDTNVIYPLANRDLLFWFAYYELYTPKWSKHIFAEWEKVMRRKNLNDTEIEKRIQTANLAFPDALVKNYDSLIPGLKLPDENDRHVLAAAIKTNANVIVTNNLKDFPVDYLSTFGLTAKSANDFLTDIIDLNSEEAVKAFREMVVNRRNPNLDEFELLGIFRKQGLLATANYLHSQL